MEQLIDKLLEMGMGQFMDHSRQDLIMTDEVYLKDIEDEGELEQRYMRLDLPDKKRILINDYIACLMTREHRMADISYMAGISDSIKFLNAIGLLKGSKNKHFKKCLKKL